MTPIDPSQRELDWNRALGIFAEARDLPPDEQALWIDRQCAEAPALGAEVRSLLDHHRLAEPHFLAPPSIPAHAAETPDNDPLIGVQLGAFRINSMIARGGMGTVYLADQSAPQRKIAVKVLHSGILPRSAEQRFDSESRILAYLQHPGIAQVYVAGIHRLPTGETLRFFAMEFVADALSVTDYARKHALPLRDRLALFLDACDAVEYGHRKGVIHRDLKPANLLVSTDRRIKVIDFGVARVTDSDVESTTMHTEAGQILGTLAYMSPEQCAADPARLSMATDVYALGVILFELLTERMPYDLSRVTIHSAIRIICERPPDRPGQLDRALRGDMQAIILRTLEKNPSARYATVAELATDIRHYLCGEPISARRPSLLVRVLRWAARNPRTAVALTSVCIAALILGSSIVAMWIVNSRPGDLILTKHQQEWDDHLCRRQVVGDSAVLKSLGGKVLRAWSVGDPSGIVCAAMPERPALWGGGKVVVLGFSGTAKSPYRGRLCVFDANDADGAPIWTGSLSQGDVDQMPDAEWPRPPFDPARTYSAEGFVLARAWVFDVFPGDRWPGMEIVTFHQYQSVTQGALRIYSLEGELLFQAWQDGGIVEAQWLPKVGLLVLAGLKGDKDLRETSRSTKSPHPFVVFAIRPKPGEVSTRWIHPHAPEWWPGKWYKPEWYKMVCPPVFADPQRIVPILCDRIATPRIFDEGTHFQLALHAQLDLMPDFRLPGIAHVIDQKGEIVWRPSPLTASAQAAMRSAGLPDVASFELVNWDKEALPCSSD